MLAGCGAHHAAGPPSPPVSRYCGTPPGGLQVATEWLRTRDGVRLYTATAGKGDTTLVLAHESGGVGLCGWLPVMAHLAQHGIHTVAFDFRGVSPSDIPRSEAKFQNLGPDLQAAIDAAGTKHVFLMGASMGGAAAITFGPALHGIDGIVNLSGELNLPTSHLDAIANASKLRVPLLIVASRDDPYLDASDAGKLSRVSGSSDTKLILLPGRYHGWDMLDIAPMRKQLWAQILAWVAAH